MNDATLEELEHRIENRIDDKLEKVPALVKGVWALLCGAFGLGIWVAGIQMEINNHNMELAEARKARQDELASIKALEIKDSADTQILKSIVEKLDRIERKLNP
jgi:hypothetical protein